MQCSRKTSKKTLNKGSKKGKTLMRHGGKNKKKSLKKTQAQSYQWVRLRPPSLGRANGIDTQPG